MSTTKPPIRAAGAVVLRTTPEARAGEQDVALIHRERYDDWTLPKGKLERDEWPAVAAVREVAEETGLTVRLGVPLDRMRYRLPDGDTKIVDHWVATVVAEEPRPPDEEVDAVEWVPVAAARTRLTHDIDRALLDQAVSLPPTTPLVLLRHCKAVSRKDWSAADADRPLSPYGERQAMRVVSLLGAYGIERVTSSAWLRCVQSVRPYAATLGVDVEPHPALTEDAFESDPEAAADVVAEARMRTAAGLPTVVCGHRPGLPQAQEGLDIPPRKLRTGEAAVAHLDREGNLVAVEWQRAVSS
ncbi:NUDIX hydrolase [Microlunatus sp. Y2014]|uniref:NUDIX hydrolase n=1 Tax=Microlunatus sp. Y2014 TaxID=3418488 RepID=UPI003DA6D43F